jgi:glycosyltransferase involved in cell wall biosynthesis
VLPVDAAAWPRSPRPSVVVLGRLVPHKRVELAIDAIAALPGATLTVVGHGYWEPQLRTYAERLGVGDAVTFTGYVDDVTKHRLLAAAWVHALPSVKEGWSLAVWRARRTAPRRWRSAPPAARPSRCWTARPACSSTT